MAIEIKQMLIKSTVLQRESEKRDGDLETDLEIIKADILEECRQLLTEALRKERER